MRYCVSGCGGETSRNLKEYDDVNKDIEHKKGSNNDSEASTLQESNRNEFLSLRCGLTMTLITPLKEGNLNSINVKVDTAKPQDHRASRH